METEAKAEPRGRSYAEQQLFDISPFNLWITTALLFATLTAAYALSAGVDGVGWIVRERTGPALDHNARVALVLSLIVCSILGLQRYSRFRDLADAPAFALALKPGVNWAPQFSTVRLRLFTAAGAIIGGACMVAFMATRQGPDARHIAISVWFFVVAVLLATLFFRGLVLTGAAARHTRSVIRTGLQIDLLKIDRLYPWGRAAARTSLIWFTVSAATLLLFASSGFTLYTAAVLLGCAAIGLWVFVGTLGLVHHEIRQAKAAELDSLRSEIAALRRAMQTDATAGARLHGLLAYEARIEAAPEWPFDQTILVRLGVSTLILAVPWFGQAVAGLVVENAGKVLH